jgi:elongator complex protein 3
MRELGCTRVELGVQSIYDDILKINRRGHDVKEIICATQILKDAGFKVNYHMMPNLPGSSLKKDEKMFVELFTNPSFQPDLLKIYPCTVLKNSPLYKVYQQGRYEPYTQKQLINLLLKIKRNIPPYIRIQRIIRDIPSTSIVAGNHVSNLRQILDQQKVCRCIRCREIRDSRVSNLSSRSGDLLGDPGLKLTRYDYDASNGKEIFLSFEDRNDRLHALLRLRMPSFDTASLKSILPILRNSALIREVHTYGEIAGLSQDKKIQHRGLGKKLIRKAEKITKQEFGLRKMAIISGIGVRNYYRQLGYKLRSSYMIKRLN